MKRIVSLLLAVSMVLSICATVFAATSYPDLTGANAKFAAAVDALTELKVVNGFPDGEFKPGNELTRAELAKMLVICMGLGDQVEALSARTVFSDVPATHWAAGYINAAAQSKIIIGYPDGTFQPEKNVTYAEAFTMALRALGYGNVVEAEGTWPTAYMLKAVELELTDDMEGVTASAAALRGNTAILLWNMLRTPMWRITEESETNGMTLSDRNGRIMLNVKFPDYMYVEDVYLERVDISDKDDVEARISNRVPGEDFWDYAAKIKDIDLSMLVPGMKLTALVKNYKDVDKATYLTLTPANTIVRGFMTNLKATDTKVTFELDKVEYRFEDGVHEEDFDENYYIIIEAEGKKVKNFARLPIDGEYAETQSIIDEIDEDALVIIDGKWASADDIKVGSIFTEVANLGGAGSYFAVSSESKTKAFDVAFENKEDWLGAKLDEVPYVSLDDDELRIMHDEEFQDTFAKEGEKNSKNVSWAKLKTRVKENDYAGNDVEVFYNYLGIPVRLHFGDADKNSKNAGFYAITSNGVWGEGGNKGKIYNVEAVGQDGNEAEYKTITGVEIYNGESGDLESNSDTYKDKATFAWFKFDDKNENIESIVVLENGLTSGEPEIFTSKYDIAALEDEAKINGKEIEGTDFVIYKSAYFYEATAVKNDKNKVVGFDVDVTVGRDEYDGYKLPAGTLLAYEEVNGVMKVKYVFIPAESDSNLSWGKVNQINVSKETVEITGSDATKLNEGSIKAAKGDLVGYSTNKAGDTAKIVEVIEPEYLDDAGINGNEVMIVNGDIDSDEEEEDIIPVVGSDGDLDKDDIGTTIKKYKVVKVTLKKDRSTGEVSISSVTVSENKGFDELKAVANDWDRIVIDDENRTIFVFTGVFDKNTVMEDGYVFKGNTSGSNGERV